MSLADGHGGHGGQIISIQMLRFIAAFAVLVSHAELTAYHLGRYRGIDLWRPEWVASGAFGVDLFFAISGFVMVIASAPLFGAEHGRRHFFVRRMIRIIPLYWLVTLLVVAWGVRFGPRPLLAQVLHGLAFLPFPASGGELTPPLSAGWTLNFEMLFYGIFALCLGASAKVTVRRVIGVLTALVLMGEIFLLPLPLSGWARPIVFEFAGGMVLALLYSQGIAVSGPARLAMLLSAFVLILGPPPDMLGIEGGWGRLLTWGIAGWLVLAAAVLGPLRLVSPTGWTFGGDISYALYLVHMPLLTAAQFVWRHFHLRYGAGEQVLFIVAMTIVSILAAIAVHVLCERPITRWLRKRVERA